ncbi:MAG: carbohydrate ABC transporter permease [Chloroflexi bacterium]|nr:carbohydrate ABC transporter permease [Chloroflexota bacterium]OJV92184.1 MAG: sugar ABC transporter permease [Chloroflexi bacterium 54-19]
MLLSESRKVFRPRLKVGALVVHLVLLVLSITALVPFVMLLSASFSTEESLGKNGYGLFPGEFSLDAYKFIFNDVGQIVNSYFITVVVSFGGSSMGLLIMSMLAFALSRRDFKLRRPLAFYVFFTMLFNGGLVPWYILITQYLHLKNTVFALILPYLVVPWFVLLLRTYFAGLPTELFEAAKIDGAGEWRIFFQIVVPLSTPALATVGLFSLLQYWNDWWLALLFIDDRTLYPLQYLLYTIQSNIDALSQNPDLNMGVVIPTQGVRMAMAVLAIGPIIFAFLFVQRYFVKGITLGGIKE